MRRPVFTLLVVMACTPLIAVTLLFAAASFAWMDRATMAMPAGVRGTVGELAMQVAKESPGKTDRVLKLDPENPAGWANRCDTIADKDAARALDACAKAVALRPNEDTLNDLGRAQEANRDFCAAEDSFTRANSRVNAGDSDILRNLGRTAYECGHWASSVAVFEVAEEHDAKDVASGDGDDEDEDYKADLTLDREWLVLANQANGNPRGAAASCAKAHADWKNCQCRCDGKELKCGQGN